MIIIVCLPSLPPPSPAHHIIQGNSANASPFPPPLFSSPPGMSWKLSGFEGSKKEAESNALVCEKGTVIETSTSYMLTLSCNNTVIFFFSFFSLNTQLQWTSIQTTETAHTVITPTRSSPAERSPPRELVRLKKTKQKKHTTPLLLPFAIPDKQPRAMNINQRIEI